MGDSRRVRMLVGCSGLRLAAVAALRIERQHAASIAASDATAAPGRIALAPRPNVPVS